MSERVPRRLINRFGPLLAVAVLGMAGCGSDPEESTASNTESTVAVTAGDRVTTDEVIEDDVVATTDDPTDGDAEAEPETEGLSAEQADAAIDIARAYFVAKTDFTGDQFEWTLTTAARDNEGRWWARVSAEPSSDMSLETEQIYVYNEADGAFWFAYDMGTGIEPATDERFPEEVRDQL